MGTLDKLIQKAGSTVGRRSFMKGAGVAGVSAAGLTLLGGTLREVSAQPPPDLTDFDIVNFALNLEYLEAEFYSVITTGKTITELGIIPANFSTGPTTGGKQVFDRTGLNGEEEDLTLSVAEDITFDEQQHVKFLVKFLGDAAVKKPTINLDALGIGFGSVEEYLILARAFEDVGVSAYGGAAPLISSKDILAAAARIALTEAEHSGNIRYELVQRGIVAPKVDAKDIPPMVKEFFSTDDNALAIVRTTSEVLRIVYAGGECFGGFFPDGMNGTIRCA